MRLIPFVLVCGLVACKNGGSSGEEGEAAPECDTEGAAEGDFLDEVGLDVVSIDAHRTVSMGNVRYDLIVHGAGMEFTQFIIAFDGMPVEGMQYEVTEALANEQPVITLYPSSYEGEVVAGTLTFTKLATETDEMLEIELRLELTTGRLDGCIRAILTNTSDGTDPSDTSGGSGSTGADTTG